MSQATPRRCALDDRRSSPTSELAALGARSSRPARASCSSSAARRPPLVRLRQRLRPRDDERRSRPGASAATRCSTGCSRPSTPQRRIDNSPAGFIVAPCRLNVVDRSRACPCSRASIGSISRSSPRTSATGPFRSGAVVVAGAPSRHRVLRRRRRRCHRIHRRHGGRPPRAGQPLRRGGPDQRPGPDRDRYRRHGPPHVRDDAVGLPLVRPGRRRSRLEAARAARGDAPPPVRPRPTRPRRAEERPSQKVIDERIGDPRRWGPIGTRVLVSIPNGASEDGA